MKTILMLLQCLVIVGCGKTEIKTDIIPEEYFFSKEKSIIHYSRVGHVRQGYKVVLKKDPKSEMFVLINFLDNKIIDSSIYTNKFKIDYLYLRDPFDSLDDNLYEAKVSSNRIFESGSKKRKRLNFTFYNQKDEIKVMQEERFVSDTTIYHNGLPIKCLITEGESVFEKNNNKKVIKKRCYWTKKYGLIMFNIKSDAQATLWYQTYSE